MLDAEKLLDHGQVQGQVPPADLLLRQAYRIDDCCGNDDRSPVGREQPREARYHEIGCTAGSLQGHENHETADQEKQLDPIIASRKSEGGGHGVTNFTTVVVGAMENGNAQRGEASQRIQFENPPRRATGHLSFFGGRRKRRYGRLFCAGHNRV